MTTQIILMVICLLLSAYFSATETAFSSINKTRLKAMAEKGNKKAEKTLTLAEDYDKLISTILIGNNIVNIALASIGTVLFVNLYGDIGATVSTVVITVAVLIFGEITPKSIAKDFPEKFAMFSMPYIRLLIWILTPVSFIFSLWKKLVGKLFKGEEDDKMSPEELLMIVEEAEQEGGIDTDEGDLLRNAIEFTEIRAEDILTHRVDLEAVSTDADKEEISRKLGKAQSTLSNKLRLLRLPEDLRDKITYAGLTERHARALLTLPDNSTRGRVLDIIIERHLTVSESERLINDVQRRKKSKNKPQMRAYKDMRIFLNTLNHAVDAIRKAGIEADTAKSETDEYFEYVIRISKPEEATVATITTQAV